MEVLLVDGVGGNEGIDGECGVGNVGDCNTSFSSWVSSSVSFSSVSELSSTVTSMARVRPVNDDQAAPRAFHSTTNTRTKMIRLSRLSTFDFDFDRIEISEEGGVVDRTRNVAIVRKSAGDEYERLGFDRCSGDWCGGGKRKDFVDQVFTRLRDVFDVPSGCKLRTPPSVRKKLRSSDGVDGGARGEANTSNWRERYVREFI